MARFRLTAGCHFATTQGLKSLKAGSTIADSNANALAGDFVVPNLSSTTMSPAFIALDASATTMKNGSRFGSTPAPSIDGANSVEG